MWRSKRKILNADETERYKEKTSVHQYLFSTDLKRTRTLFATLETE